MIQTKEVYSRAAMIKRLREMDAQIIHGSDFFAQCAEELETTEEEFHPLAECDVLNQPGSRLKDYVVGDNRSRLSYASQRLLKVVLLTYMKHHKGQDVIGWEELSDEMWAAICEAIGDDEFVKWNETTSFA